MSSEEDKHRRRRLQGRISWSLSRGEPRCYPIHKHWPLICQGPCTDSEEGCMSEPRSSDGSMLCCHTSNCCRSPPGSSNSHSCCKPLQCSSWYLLASTCCRSSTGNSYRLHPFCCHSSFSSGIYPVPRSVPEAKNPSRLLQLKLRRMFRENPYCQRESCHHC